VASRRNVVYAVINPVLFLDVHLTLALDRWRAASGSSVRGWLDALGSWEALSALAALAYDNPGWCDPVFTDGAEVRVSATAAGHPLLSAHQCVCNDVELGPPGTFLLVTGSNMSGKTTLLRAIGANAVLAGAGAPVCARAFSLPPVRVHTSMRIDDSLAQGVSLFMAELLRIRGIVEAADAQGPPVLYLLDEILHGTNTAERRVAARAVIRHLLAKGAVGAVSSHDLTLAEAADLDAAASKVHFREQVGRAEGRTHLTFDYLLRPGLATTRNALKLLDAVGLGDLVGEADVDGG
jgi:DNA mismatch repair ATPase MutS